MPNSIYMHIEVNTIEIGDYNIGISKGKSINCGKIVTSFFFEFYTFEKNRNYQSHGKTIIIIRIIIMLFCARQQANICRSAYIFILKTVYQINLCTVKNVMKFTICLLFNVA